jgi:membrane protease YdiL (CAAX protease family)
VVPLSRPDRWDILRFVLFFILGLVLSLLILIALAAVTGNLPASRRMEDLTALQAAWLNIGIAFALSISLGGSVWFAVQRRNRPPAPVLAFEQISAFAVVGCVIGMILWAFAASFLITAVFGDVRSQIENPLQDLVVSDATLIVAVALACVVAPIAEEMLFRGLLFGWLRAHWPFWPTALVTAALFGAAHGKAGAMYALLASLLGVGLALFREHSGSLWGSISAHIANNVLFIGISLLKSDWF